MWYLIFFFFFFSLTSAPLAAISLLTDSKRPASRAVRVIRTPGLAKARARASPRPKFYSKNIYIIKKKKKKLK